MIFDIVATLGPASRDETAWQAMISAGATSFRLNTSHISIPELHFWLDQLGPFLERQRPGFSLVLDLQGSKWRLGSFVPFELRPGKLVQLVLEETTNVQDTLPVPHLDFFQAAALSSSNLALNDAKIHLKVEGIEAKVLKARVVQGGNIEPNKGITYLTSEFRQENLNAKDRAILEQTQGQHFIRYAISYIKDAQEMSAYRQWLGDSISLIAKLERQSAIDDAMSIADIADELWLCRGDLGAELGLKAMAEQVYSFRQIASRCPKPVLMAGQVLEHMTAHASPTRSEICFLYDTLASGYRGVVLSDETAIGLYPIESIKTCQMFKT